jgi:hypothetical protein
MLAHECAKPTATLRTTQQPAKDLKNMKISIKRKFISLCVAAACLASAGAHALEMTAFGITRIGENPEVHVSDGPTSTGYSVQVSSDIGHMNDDATSEAYANQDAVFRTNVSGSNTFAARAEVRLGESITNRSGASANPTFHFELTPADLWVYPWSGYTGADRVSASMFIDILLDGQSIWHSHTTLAKTAAGYSFTEDGHSIFNMEDESQYRLSLPGDSWAPRPFALDLGLFEADQSKYLEYVMIASAEGNVRGRFMSWEVTCDSPFDSESCVPGTYSTYGTRGEAGVGAGDPFVIDFAALQASLDAPSDVPEPASLALIGAGLLGMGALRRKAQRSN